MIGAGRVRWLIAISGHRAPRYDLAARFVRSDKKANLQTGEYRGEIISQEGDEKCRLHRV